MVQHVLKIPRDPKASRAVTAGDIAAGYRGHQACWRNGQICKFEHTTWQSISVQINLGIPVEFLQFPNSQWDKVYAMQPNSKWKVK